MASNKVLSIDITNESITIIEITASQKKQTTIHKVLIFETPEDSYEDGIIREPERIAAEIRNQLSAAGITNKNAIFVMSSTKIVNREVEIPYVKENKIRGIINANASDYFPVNIEDYVVSHTLLETLTGEDGAKKMRVMTVAAPMQMVQSYYDLGAACGLKVQAIDYIGNSMLQLIKTQTTANATTMVIQLGSESTVLNIVQGDKLLLQRTVPYGTSSVVQVVMDEKGVDATTAMTMLQNDRIITVDFDDNDATGAFRYLINNIGRVMDYYASKNPDRPIDDVFLTGDGALIRGIDGLFKIQLNVNTKIMDSLYNIKFDPGIDLRIYSPVYLITPIGAAMNPMGFEIMGATKAASSGGGLAPYIAFAVIAAVAAAGVSFFMLSQKSKKEDDKAALEAQINEMSYIEQVIAEHDAAQAKAADIAAMSLGTYALNENALTFINELEDKIPSAIYITSFTASSQSISIPGVAASYDDIAEFIVNLKQIECIQDVFITSISQSVEEGTSNVIYNFTLTCTYVDPFAGLAEAATEEEVVVEEESAE